MGHRDRYKKRLKWTATEKRMVKELRAQGLKLEVPVLELRRRAAQLGKFPMIPPPQTHEMSLSQWGQRQQNYLSYVSYDAYYTPLAF